MTMRILTTHSGEIVLSPILPATLPSSSVPESVCYGASGPFGRILVQHLDLGGISVWYSTLCMAQDEEITYVHDAPALRLQVVLRNSYNYTLAGLGKGVLHERGVCLNFVPSMQMTLRLRKQETYSHVTIYYPTEHLRGLQDSFGGMGRFLHGVQAGVAAQFHPGYGIADARMLSLINELLDSRLSARIRRVYLGSLAAEVLLLGLIKLTESRPDVHPLLNGAEVDKIYSVREWLLQDLGRSFSLPEIAVHAGLSAYKLNNGFKALYGIGVMAYLLEARMEKAHAVLLETDTAIPIVARESGYPHTPIFSLAFKKYFGYTPIFVQKSGRKSSLVPV